MFCRFFWNLFPSPPPPSVMSSVQSFSHVWLFVTPWTAARQASLSITNSWSLLKLMSIESVMAIQPSYPVFCFSSCPQSFPASESFPMSQLFASGGQSIGVSAWTSVLTMNIQGWFPLGWIGWISLQSKELSILRCSAFFIVQLSHPYMTTGKTKALTRWTFVGKVMSLLFNMLSRSVIAFLPRCKCLLIYLHHLKFLLNHYIYWAIAKHRIQYTVGRGNA